MKKHFIYLIFFSISTVMMSQSPISKGSYSFGGAISYSSQSYDDNTSGMKIFNATPHFGYFIFNNLYVAFTTTYSSTSLGENSNVSWGIGPITRYYFNLDRLKPFIGIGFSYYNLLYTNNQSSESTSYTNLKFSGGVDYFVHECLAIELSTNYSFIKYKEGLGIFYTNNTYEFNLEVGLNYFIY